MSNPRRKPTLLIVDDEPNFSESLQMALDDTFAVAAVASLGEGIDYLRGEMPDAILLDIRLPDGDGIELLREMRRYPRPSVVIVMTAHATVENAVSALKEGAADYVVKPFDIERLKRELAVHLENRSLQRRIVALDREIRQITPPFVTSGGRMNEIVDKARMVAPLDIPVLIRGETGTGKEKLARWLHELSGMKGEFVAINCAALPKDILESELFGYAKGAFSGAAAYKEGLVEKADGGTLFLDEIGDLPEEVQAKFLRVLEDGLFYKLGDTREHKTNFRLISATNRELTGPSGTFRRDLFYRVNGITLDLPPLRERRDDIPLLAALFIKEANHAYRKEVKSLSPRAMALLARHDWPGNIRELKWCVNKAVALAGGEVADIDAAGLAPEEAGPPPETIDFHVPFPEAMERLEKSYIDHALSVTGNNKTEAARMLGISVRALHYKLDKYDL
jgi:DNA-binding NtrC family response regulator